jgi:hypothetical protein
MTLSRFLASYPEVEIANYSTPEQIAEAVYEAATDKKDQLR